MKPPPRVGRGHSEKGGEQEKEKPAGREKEWGGEGENIIPIRYKGLAYQHRTSKRVKLNITKHKLISGRQCQGALKEKVLKGGGAGA